MVYGVLHGKIVITINISVIIDEFSMLKSDLIYQIDMRLKEIKQNQSDFGGVSLIVFGDPLQLKPVMGRYPWEEPRHQMYREAHLIYPLWNLLRPVILRTNHRQGDDREYGDILNRIRVETWNIDDIKRLKARVVPKGHPSIPADSIFIFARNIDVNQMNDDCLDDIEGDEYCVKALCYHPTLKNFTPKVLNTGNIANTNLQQILKIKVNCKVMVTYNLNTTDSIVNGALGTVVGVKLNEKNQVVEFHVHFSNSLHGKETAKKFPDLLKKYGVPVVPITRYEAVFRLGRENVGVKSTATALQFPLKLSFSVTSHKVK